MEEKKIKITEENIEGYRKYCEEYEMLFDEDIKKILKRILLTLGLGVGFTFVLPTSMFLVSLFTTLGCTMFVATKSASHILDKREDDLIRNYSDLNLSVDVEVLRQEVAQFEKEKNDTNAIEPTEKQAKIISFSEEQPLRDRNKILVKRYNENKYNEDK